jgi:hypothetical protein
VSLLRRYFNSLYPLACTWLRNLAQSYPGCTLIPSRTIILIQVDPLHASSHFSARSRCSYPTPVFGIGIYQLPSSLQHHWHSPTPAWSVCVQLSRSSRNEAVLPLVPPNLIGHPASPRLAKVPRSRNLPRSDRSRHQERTAWTLLRHSVKSRWNSCRLVPQPFQLF